MKNIYKLLYLFLVIIGLSGCSAHSPMIISNTTDINYQEESSKQSEHNRSVYITTADLPKSVKYEILATLDVGKVWYGSSEWVLKSLAVVGRKVGADAVINVKTWHQPSGWAWSAPHGSGKAIKILKPSSFDLNRLDGEWK